MVRWTDRPAMTIAVDMGRKATKQTNKLTVPWGCLWFVIVVFPDHTHLQFFVFYQAK